MKKCKICGEIFTYHISSSHLEKHNVTREEYKNLPGREDVFVIKNIPFDKDKDDVDNYVRGTVEKNKKRSHKY